MRGDKLQREKRLLERRPLRNPSFSCARYSYSRTKFTVMIVSTSTGWPLRSVGL
jgi:hypothetical protein